MGTGVPGATSSTEGDGDGVGGKGTLVPPRGEEATGRATGTPGAAAGVPAEPGEAERGPEERGEGERKTGLSAQAAGEFEARIST